MLKDRKTIYIRPKDPYIRPRNPWLQPALPMMSRARKMMWVVFLAAILAVSACAGDAGESRVHYVNAAASPGGDGTSWSLAYQHPQDALNASGQGDQVWVAQGVYQPRYEDGSEVVQMAAGVEILGGFSGTEVTVLQRDPAMYLTVLDGKDVSFHVVTGADNAVLDGFTITGGNADGGMLQGRYGGTFTGGGMFNANVSPTVRNCIFAGNFAIVGGGAVYNEDNDARITDCTFEYNRADFGGAVQNRGSRTRIVNSLFRGNESRISGGAAANFNGSPSFVNNVFSGNSSSGVGGAVLNNSSEPVFTNCSFTGNSADAQGGGIGSWQGYSRITNCILWDNRSGDGQEISTVSGDLEVKYSIVQGGFAGSGNQDAHPRFTEDGRWTDDGKWIEGSYELLSGSPAVDSGTAAGAPDFDLRYNLRPQSFAHDLGAYERSVL